MTKSFDQKSAAYWAILKANPDTSATNIYKRYKGTSMGMRKQESLSLTKELKKAVEMRERNANSSMKGGTQKRVNRGAYNAAKRQSIGGVRRDPYKKGEQPVPLEDTIKYMYGDRVPTDHREFYPELTEEEYFEEGDE